MALHLQPEWLPAESACVVCGMPPQAMSVKQRSGDHCRHLACLLDSTDNSHGGITRAALSAQCTLNSERPLTAACACVCLHSVVAGLGAVMLHLLFPCTCPVALGLSPIPSLHIHKHLPLNCRYRMHGMFAIKTTVAACTGMEIMHARTPCKPTINQCSTCA